MNKDTFKLKKRNYSDKHFKGSIVDDEQLIEALDDEILAGVGREIERREELIKD